MQYYEITITLSRFTTLCGQLATRAVVEVNYYYELSLQVRDCVRRVLISTIT